MLRISCSADYSMYSFERPHPNHKKCVSTFVVQYTVLSTEHQYVYGDKEQFWLSPISGRNKDKRLGDCLHSFPPYIECIPSIISTHQTGTECITGSGFFLYFPGPNSHCTIVNHHLPTLKKSNVRFYLQFIS